MRTRPWRKILVSTFQETLRDDAQGLAAQLSYYVFLSFFQLLLALVALASLFPLRGLTDNVTTILGPIAPKEVVTLINEQLVAISERPQSGLLAIGLVAALWSASAAMGAVVNAMNRAIGVDETRPWWKVRLVSLLLTAGLGVFVLISISLVLAGPQAADWIARTTGLGSIFVWTWKIVQWPIAFGLVAIGIGLIYHFAPNTHQRWRWITPGSLAATSLWLLGSLGFRVYVVSFSNFEGTYGALGGVIVVLLWFYVSGLAILVGAELDAEIAATEPRERRTNASR